MSVLTNRSNSVAELAERARRLGHEAVEREEARTTPANREIRFLVNGRERRGTYADLVRALEDNEGEVDFTRDNPDGWRFRPAAPLLENMSDTGFHLELLRKHARGVYYRPDSLDPHDPSWDFEDPPVDPGVVYVFADRTMTREERNDLARIVRMMVGRVQVHAFVPHCIEEVLGLEGHSWPRAGCDATVEEFFGAEFHVDSMNATNAWLGAQREAREPATIKVTPKLHEVVDAACAALQKHPNLYQREGQLVQVMKVDGRVAWARENAIGTPTLRPIPSATLACELTRFATWTRYDARAKADVACEPSERVVNAVQQAGRWSGVRTLHAVVETPMLRADGSILQSEGYDHATCAIFDSCGVDFPAVPNTPALEDAKRAMAALVEPFEEFPFASDADRFVPVASVLTALAMGALEGANVPAFTFDANVQGTGKTLCADACSWILTGREVAKQTFPGDDKNELEKILAGAALAATPMLMLDNVNGVLGGDALEQRLTCRGTSQFRVLGRTGNVQLPWRTIVLASGNNLRTTVDMRRRVLRCRLVSKVENPEARDIKRRDLRGWIRARRPALVAAGLTVLRAYVVAGKPRQAIGAMGNFEEWSDLVASAIKWTTGVDVLEARLPAASAFDPVTEAYAEFLSRFDEAEDAHLRIGRDYSAKEIAALPCWDELVPADDRNRNVRVVGLLRQMIERPVNGRQVIKSPIADRHKGTAKWRVVRV